MSFIWNTYGDALRRYNKEQEEKERERKQDKREAEREEREWRRQERIEEARWRREERARKAEEERQKRARRIQQEKEKALQFLSEHLGIKSFEEIESRVHAKQKIFLTALQKAIEHHRNDLDRWYKEYGKVYSKYWTVEIPFRLTEDDHRLIRRKTDLTGNHFDQFELVGEYDGEPLNPRIGSYEPPMEFRKTALQYLNRLYIEPGNLDHKPIDPPFAPRHLKTMKCMYENPGITTKEIAQMVGWEFETPKRWKKEIKTIALKQLPKYPDFTIPKGNNKHVHADVVPPYWWQQGLCFETE